MALTRYFALANAITVDNTARLSCRSTASALTRPTRRASAGRSVQRERHRRRRGRLRPCQAGASAAPRSRRHGRRRRHLHGHRQHRLGQRHARPEPRRRRHDRRRRRQQARRHRRRQRQLHRPGLHDRHRLPPNVTVEQEFSQNDPTTASPINFTATFSEPVTGFTGSDVSFTGSTAGTGGTAAGLSVSPSAAGPRSTTSRSPGWRSAERPRVDPGGRCIRCGGEPTTLRRRPTTRSTWDRVPSVTTPSFSPPRRRRTTPYQASTTTSDPDGDNISVAWTWKVDRGGDICTVQTNSSLVGGRRRTRLRSTWLRTTSRLSCTGALINPLNPSKGDVITVEVTPNDGLFDGSTASDNVTVKNTLPTVTLSGANNLSPNEGATNTYSYSISDADGDTIASVATSCGTGTKTNAVEHEHVGQLRLHVRGRPGEHVGLRPGDRLRLRRRRRQQRDAVDLGAERRAVDRDQRRDERERGLGLQPDAGRGHRSGHGHGLELHRPLGRRQQRHATRRTARRRTPTPTARPPARSLSTWSTRTARSSTARTPSR